MAPASSPGVMSGPPSRDDIAAAFRLLLDREPDPGGLEHYAGMAAAGGLTHARLREIMLASEEYRRRHRARQMQVGIGAAVVVIDPEDPAFGAHIAAEQDWEPHVAAVIERHLPPGGVFVDVGANVGAMAFRAALRVGPAGRVIAFEPDPSNISHFLQGVDLAGFRHVVLFPVALSNAPAVFALQGGSNAYLAPADATATMAQAMRGDDLLAGEPRIDLIKLDIEGHEPQALRGLAGTLARHRPMVLAEFNPRCLRDHIGADPAAFAAELFALAPRIIAIRHDGAETMLNGAAALLDFWARCNREAVEAGQLPDGMLHLDLLFRVA